jgi:hypothetical protein
MLDAVASGIAPDQRWVTGGMSAILQKAKLPGWRLVLPVGPSTAAATPLQALALRSLDVEHPGLVGARLHTDGPADPWAIEAAVVNTFDGTTLTPVAVVDVDGQTAG